MPRKKSTEALDAEIAKTKSDMAKLQDKYDRLAGKLKELQEQRQRIEADTIVEAYLKSGKSFDELMTFLQPQGF